MAQIITSAEELDFTIGDIPSMPLPGEVLMVRPLHYSVDYIINPHMSDQVGKVNQAEAHKEWNLVRSVFEQLEIKTNIIEDQEGLPDMVFCANQSLPFIDENGNKHVFMSIMHADERKNEVPFIEQWYRQKGYKIHYLNEKKVDNFEGCGDAIWHTGKRLLWGGYGYRSDVNAYEIISDIYNVPIIALELVDESFYHLDTCFCVLDKETALIYPDAFTDKGIELINSIFSTVIHASQHEAEKMFACNASCPDGRNVIIQQGCTDVNKNLRDKGFSVHEVNTYEFLKSGGSVFCMKMLLW